MRANTKFILFFTASLIVSSLYSSFCGEAQYAGLFLASIIIIISAIKITIFKSSSFKFSVLEKYLVVFLLYSLLSIISNYNPNGVRQISTLLFSLTTAYIISNIDYTPSLASLQRIFIFYSLVQCSIIILQIFDIIPTVKPYFIANGTMGNPNAVALTLIIPSLFLYTNFPKNNNGRIIRIFTIITVTVTIILLKCRTAWISILFGIGILYYPEFKASFLKLTYRRKVLLICIITLFSAAFSQVLYNIKPESTAGRALVWKISYSLIKENPMFGIGIGNFSKEYNLKQAQYFSSGKYSTQEYNVASNTNMPYNSLMLIAIELGLTGLLLSFFLVISIIMLIVKSDQSQVTKRLSLSILLSVFVASLFNYTIIIPTLTFQLILVYCFYSKKGNHLHLKKKRTKIFAALALSSLLIFFIIGSLQQVHLSTLIKKQTPDKLIEYYKKNKIFLSKHPKALYYYGKSQYQTKEYNKSLNTLTTVSQKETHYNIYLMRGRNHLRLGQYAEAEADFLLAHYMVPSLIRPKYDLIILYIQTGQDKKAKDLTLKTLDYGAKVKNDASTLLIRKIEQIEIRYKYED